MSRHSRSLGRRSVLAGTGALALAAPSVARAATVKVSIGRQPWAAGNSPITQYMMNNRLFEKEAATHGIELTAEYRDYPSALPMVETILGGDLDFGMWGNTPIIRVIAAQQPISTLMVGEGHLRFIICTRDGSPVRNMADLKGKVVGALLGGDPYNALSQMLRFELGSGDPQAYGIRVVNTPTAAQAAAVPTGMDAACTTLPSFLAAQATGTVGIVNSFGYTEGYYDGPAGKGGGILLPSVKKSPFYPDGYYLHRSFWVVRNAVIAKYPEVVIAFVTAHQQACAALTAMDRGAVSQLVFKYWKLPPDQGAQVVGDEVLFRRGWAWPTEGDARAVLETSKYMVEGRLIEKPLTWDQVKGGFSLSLPLVKEAYLRLGSKPDDAEFTNNNAGDLRGLPVWEMDKWSQKS